MHRKQLHLLERGRIDFAEGHETDEGSGWRSLSFEQAEEGLSNSAYLISAWDEDRPDEGHMGAGKLLIGKVESNQMHGSFHKIRIGIYLVDY